LTTVSVTKLINAPEEKVFMAVSDISNLPKTNPDIIKIEFQSDLKSGIGTKFRETRIMNRKESVTDLEVTEYEENSYIRMVADSHGTIWDSIFTIKMVGEQTELKLTMDAKSQKLLPKLLNPLFKGLYKKGLEKHMEAVKSFCEKQ
jgi:polyketide cyclase/dehydrase/lipid transport protein